MVRELRAAGRGISRRSTSTPTRLWGNFESSTPCKPSRAPTQTQVTRGHLRVTWAGPGRKRGTQRGPRGALTWPGGHERAGSPGGCGNFPPGARSTGWRRRPESLASRRPALKRARPPTADPGERARAHTHLHSLAHSHAQPQSLSAPGQCEPGAPCGDAAATGSAPCPPPGAAPAPLPAPTAGPRAGPQRRARSPRPAPGPPPAPSAVARNGAAPCAHPPGEAGEGSAAPAPRPPKIRAALRSGRGSRTGERQPPLGPPARALARGPGRRGRGRRGRAGAAARTPASFLPPPSFFSAGST